MNVTEAVETLRSFVCSFVHSFIHHTSSCSFTSLVICASVYWPGLFLLPKVCSFLTFSLFVYPFLSFKFFSYSYFIQRFEFCTWEHVIHLANMLYGDIHSEPYIL